MNRINLGGLWNVRLQDGHVYQAALPGTLDESRIGYPDQGSNQWHPGESQNNTNDLYGSERILTRLTRIATYEGPAWFERTLRIDTPQDHRAFITAERSRELTLTLNGQPILHAVQGTVSTPYVFEITSQLLHGNNHFSFCCDNSYPSWPREDIIFSSAATDETQTNWNGILGEFEVKFQKNNYISAVRVYPTLTTATVLVEIDCQSHYSGMLTLRSKAFMETVRKPVELNTGTHQLCYAHIPLKKDCMHWDEQEGNLYDLTVQADGMDAHSVCFGVRTFSSRCGRLTINNRPVFIRSEANCCVFPQTGHMPLNVDEWLTILKTYQSYGVNCMRFHSHCPPDAAFAAADRLGMMMQPELSHWNPHNALEDDKSFAYYQLELSQILRAYANHPSFVMLTFGNELHTGSLGHTRMDEMLKQAKTMDATRLYANGSNVHYGLISPSKSSDFYTSSNYFELMIRGTSAQMHGYINNQYPSTCHSYDAELAAIRQEYDHPVVSFEVGQYEVLPDFDELPLFTGITRAENIVYIKERVQAAGLMDEWKRRVEATGELSLIGYREEVEAVLRTQALSGISLLGLQDFPGQGTALVGMLNSHLQPKPFSFADCKRFRAFFTDVLPLALLSRYTYRQGEQLSAPIKLANYGKHDMCAFAQIALMSNDDIIAEITFAEHTYESGALSSVGTINFPLQNVHAPQKLRLAITIGQAQNNYSLWVYPETMQTDIDGVVITAGAQEALGHLRDGKKVLLDPPSDEAHLPQSIQAQFTSDFWSVGTFAKQSGFMGCLVDPQHPVFHQFPTDFHTDWQWWPMCRSRAMILPPQLNPLITGIDCYARLRHLGMLLEADVLGGKLILSSMGLHAKQEHPEAKALLASILGYMASDDFQPKQTMTAEQLTAMVR